MIILLFKAKNIYGIYAFLDFDFILHLWVRGALTRSPTPGKLQLFSKNFMIIIITALIILRRVSLLLSSKRIIYGKIVNYFSNHWC